MSDHEAVILKLLIKSIATVVVIVFLSIPAGKAYSRYVFEKKIDCVQDARTLERVREALVNVN